MSSADNSTSARFRSLPSLDRLLRDDAVAPLLAAHGRGEVREALTAALDAARSRIRAGEESSEDSIVEAARQALSHAAVASLRGLFNLTGTVLHTNLGRALLADEAVAAARIAMTQAVALEYDVAAGTRGERDDHVRDLILRLTGAEDATVVNNNAAAVLLVLNSLALGREAIVSRGELIEIGGAFRMPDIMARAGVTLVEVGTTNRTHAHDYETAIGARTGLILKVHTSNYRIAGFHAEVDGSVLAAIATSRGVPLVNDLGSGTLIDLAPLGLAREPTVRDAVAEGADLVTFSGDKLLGGPQIGFVVGRRALIDRINRNPMKRALRVDKIRLAALEATLRLYLDPDRLVRRLPTLRALARPLAEIEAAAMRLSVPLQNAVGEHATVEIVACRSEAGSGSLPTSTMPSAALSLVARAQGGRAVERLAASFRRLARPVIGRIAENALLFDLRCLEDEDGFVANLAGFEHGSV